MTDIADFTLEQYGELLDLAKGSYLFTAYADVSFDRRFILWRHDCDCSLNRALRLARLEHEHGVRATYFLNPHSEFYNLLEGPQARIVAEVASLGHDLGLHFDAAFYDVRSEAALDALVKREAAWLADWFGVTLEAFSFHNPTPFLLTCDRDQYGGLINCYSRTFKERVPYCSDSNGYWRHRSLRDALSQSTEPCLQVLTHPEWWQEAPMYPRARIARAVYGRAEATMRAYDAILDVHGRTNLVGPAASLEILRGVEAERLPFYEYLWNRGEFEPLFLGLWRIHDRHASIVPADAAHAEWAALRDRIERRDEAVAPPMLESGCIYLCGIIAAAVNPRTAESSD